MKLNIRTKKDVNLTAGQVHALMLRCFKFTKDMNELYNVNLECVFRFEVLKNE